MVKFAARNSYLLSVFLVLLCLASYFPSLQNGFITFFDDNDYVTHNDVVQQGFSAAGLKWAFTTFHAANWHPVTWLSHMADVEFFGMNAAGHHFTNTLFHLLNTLLLYFFLTQLSGCPWKSLLVSALFAVHPLHVEPVAWVAERKELLGTFFGLLSLNSYSWYALERKKWGYGLTFFFFLLSLMAKPMLVTLPCLLLLLDYWPFRRLLPFREKLVNLLLEKIPFFILSIGSGAVTLFAQKSWGAVKLLEEIPFSSRLSNAMVSYSSYITKTALPADLAVYYPHPKDTIPAILLIFSTLFLVLITREVFKRRKESPVYTFGWLWYLGTLFPVIGLVQVGSQAMADRYTYFPLTGVFIMVAWGLEELTTGKPLARKTAILFSLLFISVSASMTWSQLKHWENNLTLFQRAVNVTDNNFLAHNHLGAAFLQEKMFDEAEKNFLSALKIAPGYATAHTNLANLFLLKKKFQEAIRHYKKAGELKKDDPFSTYNIGIALLSLKKTKEAVTEFKKAVLMKPDFTAGYIALGSISFLTKNIPEAREYFNKAMALEPKNETVQNYLKKITRM
ncbi:MAG: tetratricopeptide repeat protein [Nitrospinota bacterium]